MLQFKTLGAFIIMMAASSATLQCGVNEIAVDCPRDCPYDRCPSDRHQDNRPCLPGAGCPPASCKCAFNYRRADNDTCIPTTECPPFECSGVNEVFDSCPPLCPSQDCSSATPSGECPFPMLFVVSCSPACRCVMHHWRQNGRCVPYHQCLNVKR